jgi:hypothetical protein
MTASARLRVPLGAPLQATGGETSAPLHVYRAGIAPPLLNAGLVTVIALGVIAS